MKVTTRIVGGAVILAAALAGQATLAGKDPECVQACQEQYQFDKRACLAAYQAKEDGINQQRACCVDPSCWQGQWPSPAVRLQDAQRKHIDNVRGKNWCMSQTPQKAWLCRDACPDESPTAP
jgi:hypothetical protein